MKSIVVKLLSLTYRLLAISEGVIFGVLGLIKLTQKPHMYLFWYMWTEGEVFEESSPECMWVWWYVRSWMLEYVVCLQCVTKAWEEVPCPNRFTCSTILSSEGGHTLLLFGKLLYSELKTSFTFLLSPITSEYKTLWGKPERVHRISAVNIEDECTA